MIPDDLAPHEYRFLAEQLARCLLTTLKDYCEQVTGDTPAEAAENAALALACTIGDARHEAAKALGALRDAPRFLQAVA
jgi:hypothetical protein